MVEVNRDIDPTLDAAGVMPDECFVCGHKRCDVTFGVDSIAAPQLATHRACMQANLMPNGKMSPSVVLEYERRIADIVSVKRAR